MRPDISIKRIYEETDSHDGYRVLVDRLWPRGLTIEKAHIDEWATEIAPSTATRLAYAHVPERWEIFKIQYKNELLNNEQLISYLDKWEEHPIITLLYAAKDKEHTHALVLQEYLIFCYNSRK
ncbi:MULTISPECIES: DUF488 domain-containing protein [unclassified Sphingobacterium]|uniref:DUF488 domain-containing protein n=1 Tax=unclassified Sphingobacterium TaxID=2609468 RepID=UPI001052844C|nr:MULTISPECIES: DUF488 family protein [unclassified Sphingobacterium]MCS3556852.1 uncharacterized protein YeaO (DUF488 family) [Sphingobacterium sp. JUb21]TCQ99223.1 uncharacterized protein YeaO (DUF488 family) [Sphingobacterium sp. JUb20]